MNKGIGFIGLIISIGLTALIVGGGMYIYTQNMRISELAMKVKPTAIPTPLIKEIVPTSVSVTSNQPNSIVSPSLMGTINGTLIYPSEMLPSDMQACAEDTTTHITKCTADKTSTNKGTEFSLEVAPGTYYVYATVPSNPKKAYYTEFVTCGLKYGCPSHNKISVTVVAGATTTALPHDWYE